MQRSERNHDFQLIVNRNCYAMRELNLNTRRCLHCRNIITGRSDRKFSSAKCKNSWYYLKSQENRKGFDPMDRILHRNREVLKSMYYSSQGTRFIRMDQLLRNGFNTSYYLRITMNQNGTGNALYFVYDSTYKHDHTKGVKIFYRRMFPSLK